MLMDEVTPLSAASVLVLRDGPLEVLMLRRHEKSSFMPGAWVFPGGIAEPADADLRVTAVRETFEESGLWLGAPLAEAGEKRRRLLAGELPFRDLLAEGPVDFSRLVPTSRWITPVGVPKRFDTWFYLATVTRDAIATAEQNELVDAVWIPPVEALRKQADRSMQIMFPTARNLEALVGFASAAELIDSRRGAVIEPIQPVLVNGKPTLP
jgi:8-oxo-dGTP pyrophosphatase MutT (NUDIX family)